MNSSDDEGESQASLDSRLVSPQSKRNMEFRDEVESNPGASGGRGGAGAGPGRGQGGGPATVLPLSKLTS